MRLTLRAALAVALLAGFYVLAVGLVAALVALWALAAAQGLHGHALIKAGALTVLIGFAVLGGLFTRRSTQDDSAPGVELTAAQQPRLWQEVTSLATAIRTRPPDQIRLVSDVNAAVSERGRLLGLAPGPRLMLIGAPLLIGLTTDQLRAVLAHELGHYSQGHTGLALVTYRGKEAIARVLSRLERHRAVRAVVAGYARLFYAVSHSVNRRQELEADDRAADLAGRETTIAALTELAPLTAAWEAFLELYVAPGHEIGLRPERLYAGLRSFLADPQRRQQLAGIRASEAPERRSVYDTHPPISERIARLRSREQPGPVDPGEPALDLLEDVDATFGRLEHLLYDGSRLSELDWPELTARTMTTNVVRNAEQLSTSLGRLGLVPSSLALMLGECRAGRAAALTEPLAPMLSPEDRVRLSGQLIGDTAAELLVARGATFRLSWGHGADLVDVDGDVVDPWTPAARAVRNEDVDGFWAWLEDRGLPLHEAIGAADLAPQAAPAPEGATAAAALLSVPEDVPASDAVPAPDPRPTDPAPPAEPEPSRRTLVPTGSVIAGAAPVGGDVPGTLLILPWGVLLRRSRRSDTAGAKKGGGATILERVMALPDEQLVKDDKSTLVKWELVARATYYPGPDDTAVLVVMRADGATRTVHFGADTVEVGDLGRALVGYLGKRFAMG